jgi:hypothetical protein
MAKEIAKGIESAGGEASLFQVDETLSEEVLKLMHAPPKDASIPVISDPAALIEYDGILFGSGTRFGAITAQLKAFFDKSGQVWQKGGWVGKPVGIFFSTGTQGGGQETTALTTLTQFTHHGMIYVPSVHLIIHPLLPRSIMLVSSSSSLFGIALLCLLLLLLLLLRSSCTVSAIRRPACSTWTKSTAVPRTAPAPSRALTAAANLPSSSSASPTTRDRTSPELLMRSSVDARRWRRRRRSKADTGSNLLLLRSIASDQTFYPSIYIPTRGYTPTRDGSTSQLPSEEMLFVAPPLPCCTLSALDELVIWPNYSQAIFTAFNTFPSNVTRARCTCTSKLQASVPLAWKRLHRPY